VTPKFVLLSLPDTLALRTGLVPAYTVLSSRRDTVKELHRTNLLHMGNFKLWFWENSIFWGFLVYKMVRTNNSWYKYKYGLVVEQAMAGENRSMHIPKQTKKLIQCHFINQKSISGNAFYTPERNEQDSFVYRPYLYTTNFEKSFIELISSNLLP
jgi:hypothetical protein